MFSGMREWLILVAHLIVTMMKVAAPGGVQSVVAESLILKHQLLILNRSRKRAPKLGMIDRVLLGLGTLLISPRRLMKVAVVISRLRCCDFAARWSGASIDSYSRAARGTVPAQRDLRM